MKNFIFVLLALAFFSVSVSEIKSSRTGLLPQSAFDLAGKKDPREDSVKKIVSPQKSLRGNVEWIAPAYKELHLGKATEADVLRTFGKPDSTGNPDNKFDGPDKSRIFYSYEQPEDAFERIEFIMGSGSKVLTEVWLVSNYQKFLTLEKAVEMFGNEFLELKFDNERCSYEEFRYEEKLEYPVYIVYPQKGVSLFLTDENQVDTIYYWDKIPFCKSSEIKIKSAISRNNLD